MKKFLLFLGFIFPQIALGNLASYPREVIQRPFALPLDTYSVSSGFALSPKKILSWELAFNMGIGKNMFLGADYNLLLWKDFKKAYAGRILSFKYGYQFWANSFAATSLAASLPVHIASGEIIRELSLASPITFFNETFAGGVFSEFLTLNFRPNMGFKLDLPVWFGGQVTQNFWLAGSTSLGQLSMVTVKSQGEFTSTPFWKNLPLALHSTYVVLNNLDINLKIGSENLMAFKESFTASLGVETRF